METWETTRTRIVQSPVTRSRTTPPASVMINDAAAISHVEIPGPSI